MHLDQAGPADHWYVNLAVHTGGQCVLGCSMWDGCVWDGAGYGHDVLGVGQRVGESTPRNGRVITVGGRTRWYSTVDVGNCDSPDRAACAWKVVRTVKKVNATCHRANVEAAVEALGDRCFSACGSDTHSVCYINCYYATLLGPAAAHT